MDPKDPPKHLTSQSGCNLTTIYHGPVRHGTNHGSQDIWVAAPVHSRNHSMVRRRAETNGRQIQTICIIGSDVNQWRGPDRGCTNSPTRGFAYTRRFQGWCSEPTNGFSRGFNQGSFQNGGRFGESRDGFDHPSTAQAGHTRSSQHQSGSSARFGKNTQKSNHSPRAQTQIL